MSEKVEIALLEINEKLDRLLELHEKDLKKMSNHIDFIEKIYDNVKAPFTFIMDSVKTVIPSNQVKDSPDNPLGCNQFMENLLE